MTDDPNVTPDPEPTPDPPPEEPPADQPLPEGSVVMDGTLEVWSAEQIDQFLADHPDRYGWRGENGTGDGTYPPRSFIKCEDCTAREDYDWVIWTSSLQVHDQWHDFMAQQQEPQGN